MIRDSRPGDSETDRAQCECVAYRTSMREGLVAVWNDAFGSRRNFLPMDIDRWKDRIELANQGDAFEPELFRVALVDGSPVGFVHGGIWEGEFLTSLVPDNDPSAGGFGAMGHLSLIGVATTHRRRRIGSALLDSLRDTIGVLREPGLPLVVDGRVFNAFYGNFFAPRPPLWGTTEGVAVAADDDASRAFLENVGFKVDQIAQSLVTDPRIPRDATRQAYEPELDIEVVEDDDYQAILGSQGGTSFPYPNQSHSWVAIHDRVQIGYLIAFPFEEGPEEKRWGIYSLEVEPKHRGRGVARRLMSRAMEFWRERGVTEVEALVLPDESPGAGRLYASAGFESAAEWLIFA